MSTSFVAEFVKQLGRAADADLDTALGIEHAIQHRLAKRPAMVEPAALGGAGGVAMRVDMHHAHRPVAPQRTQDRVADRMVAADRKRLDPCGLHAGVERLDIGNRVRQRIAAAKRHIAHIGKVQLGLRRHPQRMVIRPDPLDRPHGARTEPRSRPIGHREVHRHADQRHIQPAEIRQIRRIRPIRRIQQRRHPGIWQRPPALGVERRIGRPLQRGVADLIASVVRVAGAQGSELFGVGHAALRGSAPIWTGRAATSTSVA